MKDYKTVKETDASGKTKGFFSSAFGLFKIPSLRWVYIGYGLQQIMLTAYLTWAPAFIMRAQGVSEAQAGLTVAAIGILAIIGLPASGILADLWQKKNSSGKLSVAVISSILAAILFALAVYYDFKGIGFIFALLMGLMVTGATPVVNTVTQDVVSPGLKGVAGASVVFYMVIFGGGWAPWAVGAISDSMGGGVEGLKLALLISSLGALLGALCFWISKRHYAADVKRVEGLVLHAE
jgi:MFS family permease